MTMPTSAAGEAKVMDWAIAILKYSRELDPKCLEANAYLPPLPGVPFHPDLPPAILVRESYPAIYEYAKQQCSKEERLSHGLVVIGQPGIGKTAFLFYALIHALHDGIPVNWCQSGNDTDWLQIDGDDIKPYCADPDSQRLALHDQKPLVLDGDGSYVVQATSPKITQYGEWSKQYSAMFWVMKNWTAEEVDREAKNRGIDTNRLPSTNDTNEWYGKYSPQDAFKIIGPSARRCFTKPVTETGDPVADFGLVKEIQKLFANSDTLRLVLRLLGDVEPPLDVYPAGFHKMFYVQDVSDDIQPLNEEELTYRAETRWQRNVIRLQIMKEELILDMTTPSIFFANRAIGRYIFESYVQQDLILRNVALDVILGGSSSSSSTTLILPPDNTIDFDSKSPPKAHLNTLYSPTISNFPSLDFFFLSKDHQVVMLQTTISAKHTKADSGIEQVIKYVKSKPALALGLDKLFFVFAAPDSASGAKFAGARSSNGEMTVLGYKMKVGYVVVEIKNAQIKEVLCALSMEDKTDGDDDEDNGSMDIDT